jgi:hypothetical protein
MLNVRIALDEQREIDASLGSAQPPIQQPGRNNFAISVGVFFPLFLLESALIQSRS